MADTTRRPRGRPKKAAAPLPAVQASTELASLDELVEAGRQALTQIVALEDGPRDQYLELAHVLINMRRHFKSPGRDFPDWRGRSQQYREAAARVYAASDIPPDSEGSIQARIRYIINDELRKVAPEEQLLALNYKTGTNAERAKDRRDRKKGKVLDVEGPTLHVPGRDTITTRAEAFRAIRQVVETAVWQLPVPEDGPEYIECMTELVATTKLMEQMWAMHERRRSVRRNTIELGSTYAATVAQHPETVEHLAAIRDASSNEARYLSAPPPEELNP